MISCRQILKDLKSISNFLILVCSPVLLLPLLLVPPKTKEQECAFVVLLMAAYWLTGALPIAVTALLPVVLLPVMGLMSAKDIAKYYMTDTSFVLLGGLLMALAVERSNLHKRLSLRVLILMGTRPLGILLGVMLSTWLLSMWISNTATTSMMLPIATNIVEQLREGFRKQKKVRGRAASGADNPGFTREMADGREMNDRRRSGDSGDVIKVVVKDDVSESCVDNSPKSLSNLETPFSEKKTENSVRDENCQNLSSSDSEVPPSGSGSMDSKGHDDVRLDLDVREEEKEEEVDDDVSQMLRNFEKMLSLGVAYSATVGGTATLTGTPPNLVFSQQANAFYRERGLIGPITFSSWALFGLPHAVICLALTITWLMVFFLGFKPCCFCCFGRHSNDGGWGKGVADAIRSQYKSLGKMTFAEISTLFFFILLVILWFTRKPGAFPGYDELFKNEYITDAVPAMFVGILLFAFPSGKPQVFCLRDKQDDGNGSWKVPLLSDWESVASKLAWGPFMIIGGGIALAEACKESGLSKLVGDQLVMLSILPSWVIVLLIVATVAMLTEVTSNTAVITLVTPMLLTMSANLRLHPLYLTLPATMASSYAFMLPVATPVNAIVFAHGRVTVLDMVKAGFAMNVACILVVTLGVHTWARLAFGMTDDFWTLVPSAVLNSTDPNGTTTAPY